MLCVPLACADIVKRRGREGGRPIIYFVTFCFNMDVHDRTKPNVKIHLFLFPLSFDAFAARRRHMGNKNSTEAVQQASRVAK